MAERRGEHWLTPTWARDSRLHSRDLVGGPSSTMTPASSPAGNPLRAPATEHHSGALWRPFRGAVV